MGNDEKELCFLIEYTYMLRCVSEVVNDSYTWFN